MPQIDPHLVARAMEDTGESVAQLWLDASSKTTATLYVIERQPPRIFVRHFDLEHGYDAVALELLSVVIQTSMEAVLAGVELGVDREQFERSIDVPPPLPAVSPPRVSPRRMRLGLLYETEPLSKQIVQNGLGAEFAFDWAPFRLGMAGQVRYPVWTGGDVVQAQLVSRSARVFVALLAPLASPITVSGGVAFGLDHIEIRPRAIDPTATAEPAFSATDWVLRSVGSLDYRKGRLEIGLSLGVELTPAPTQYSLLRSGANEAVFRPWRWRPLAALLGGVRF